MVGGGAYGLSCAERMAGAGATVELVEQDEPAGARAASSGRTRVLRYEYGDRAIFSELTLRARDRWRELERLSGERLFDARGVLHLASPGGAFEERSLEVVALARAPDRTARALRDRPALAGVRGGHRRVRPLVARGRPALGAPSDVRARPCCRGGRCRDAPAIPRRGRDRRLDRAGGRDSSHGRRRRAVHRLVELGAGCAARGRGPTAAGDRVLPRPAHRHPRVRRRRTRLLRLSGARRLRGQDRLAPHRGRRDRRSLGRGPASCPRRGRRAARATTWRAVCLRRRARR